MLIRKVLIVVFAVVPFMTACHDDDDPYPPTASASVADDSKSRNWIYENRAHNDIQQAIQVAVTMQDLWNATKDVDSARQKLTQIGEHLDAAENNLRRINDASCGYDLMWDIHANMTTMNREFGRFLTTANNKDLVRANEALFAARSSIERYNALCAD